MSFPPFLLSRCDTCLKECDTDDASCDADDASCESCDSQDDETDAPTVSKPTHVCQPTDVNPASHPESDLTHLCDAPPSPPPAPLLSSTPHRSLSDSALVLNDTHELTSSSEDTASITSSSEFSQLKDESDSESQESSASVPGIRRRQSEPIIKSVLSQSLPSARLPFIKCTHRKRRVTFSMEVTVAKVVEKSEGEETGKEVALVKVDKNKDRTKGH